MTIPDRLELRSIARMKQSFEMGCGPTSIAMVLSGFGINTTEQILAEKYFPTAMLPSRDSDLGIINLDSGVDNQHLLLGMVQILDDMGLQMHLRVDVFDSWLYNYVSSPEKRHIVEVKLSEIREYSVSLRRSLEEMGDNSLDGKRVKAFYQTLETLVENKRVRAYTANARMKPTKRAGFYSELKDFIKKGHLVGIYGERESHFRALDGSEIRRTEATDEENLTIFDPRGESYAVSLRSLFITTSSGIERGIFDYLFRVSPREK